MLHRLRWDCKYSAQCFSESPVAPRTVKQKGTDRPGGRVVRTVGQLYNVRLHLVDSVMRASPEVPLWTLSCSSKMRESKKRSIKKRNRTVYVFHIDSAHSYGCFGSSGSFLSMSWRPLLLELQEHKCVTLLVISPRERKIKNVARKFRPLMTKRQSCSAQL